MSRVTTFAESSNHPSTNEVDRLPASESQDANQRIRNAIIVGLVFEVVFLATVAAYILSSIYRYQNCL